MLISAARRLLRCVSKGLERLTIPENRLSGHDTLNPPSFAVITPPGLPQTALYRSTPEQPRRGCWPVLLPCSEPLVLGRQSAKRSGCRPLPPIQRTNAHVFLGGDFAGARRRYGERRVSQPEAPVRGRPAHDFSFGSEWPSEDRNHLLRAPMPAQSAATAPPPIGRQLAKDTPLGFRIGNNEASPIRSIGKEDRPSRGVMPQQ
jgi:hypothetical protein